MPTVIEMGIGCQLQAIEKLAAVEQQSAFDTVIDRHHILLALDRVWERMAIAYPRHASNVQQPTAMERPVVAIAQQKTVVTVTETVISAQIRKIALQAIVKSREIHPIVLVG